MADEFLFKSAHAALVFAFNFSGQAYDRPLLNRLAAPSVGTGKGLAGLDGAGQAGMIRAEVKRLREHTKDPLLESIIIARVAPNSVPCSCKSACCSGHRPNLEWTHAISVIADDIRRTALAGCTSNGLLRREYVVRYFTRKEARVSLDSIADRHECHRQTVSAHYGKVQTYMAGKRSGDKGWESIAFEMMEDRLREIGVVG